MIKNSNTLAYSSINFIWTILLSILNYIVFSVIRIYVSNFYIDFLYILSYYLIIAYTVTFLKLFEDYVKIIYIFKIFRRSRIYQYKDIEKVKLVNYIHAYEFPRIQLRIKEKSKIEWPSNTFQVYSYKQRKKVLKIFDSKGIPIEIKSDSDKELNILS